MVMGLYMREGVKKHDIYSGLKFCKFKVSGKLVVQQSACANFCDFSLSKFSNSYVVLSHHLD